MVKLSQTKLSQKEIDEFRLADKRIANLLKLLRPLESTYGTGLGLPFVKLFEKSDIKFKKSFLSYLDMAQALGFIYKTDTRKHQTTSIQMKDRLNFPHKYSNCYVFYELQRDGKNLLELFEGLR
tara:strand:+ start:38 stop:409 length:372 start_codon:yes stop_codon:yes gene_type:complete